jgi:hypothetical protein
VHHLPGFSDLGSWIHSSTHLDEDVNHETIFPRDYPSTMASYGGSLVPADYLDPLLLAFKELQPFKPQIWKANRRH